MRVTHIPKLLKNGKLFRYQGQPARVLDLRPPLDADDKSIGLHFSFLDKEANSHEVFLTSNTTAKMVVDGVFQELDLADYQAA